MARHENLSIGRLAVDQVAMRKYTVATVPSAVDNLGMMIFVEDGAGGDPVLAFSDGTDWLRVNALTAIAVSDI